MGGNKIKRTLSALACPVSAPYSSGGLEMLNNNIWLACCCPSSREDISVQNLVQCKIFYRLLIGGPAVKSVHTYNSEQLSPAIRTIYYIIRCLTSRGLVLLRVLRYVLHLLDFMWLLLIPLSLSASSSFLFHLFFLEYVSSVSKHHSVPEKGSRR